MKGEENEKGEFVVLGLDIKLILIESFEGENGMLEVCKAQYTQAKKRVIAACGLDNQYIDRDR